MTQLQNRYIPGVCNIGPAEIRARLVAGWGGLAVTILMVGVFMWLPVPKIARLVLFLPAFVAAIGFFQAAMHFCVGFASAGLFNMDKAQGVTESVDQAAFRKADQKKATRIYLYAIASAGLVSLLAILL